jgi:phage terminase large subunit
VEYKLTTIYRHNAEAYLARPQYRRALNEGGTSSSKTISILQLLIHINQRVKVPFLTSVVSESLPHLKRGCIRDFRNILGDDFNSAHWNATDHIYTWPDAGQIEFFGADESAKLRGGRRQLLFCNELNNIPYEAFKELDIRTEIFTWADWNPVSEFYAHEYLIDKPENFYIHSTYRDALWVLPESIVKNIESNKNTDPNWWNVYGLGRIGKIEGLVYPYFEQVEQLPAGNAFYGMDFGYSNDPTALVRNVILGDSLYSEELIYEAGLTNDAIAHRMEELGIRKHYDEIFADAAEPKSIEEIHKFGYNVKACPKGADSVEFGHQKLRQYKQHWTKSSLNCIKEQRNFRYIPDKDGKLTAKTTHQFSHGMDSRRYGVLGLTGGTKFGILVT